MPAAVLLKVRQHALVQKTACLQQYGFVEPEVCPSDSHVPWETPVVVVVISNHMCCALLEGNTQRYGVAKQPRYPTQAGFAWKLRKCYAVTPLSATACWFGVIPPQFLICTTCASLYNLLQPAMPLCELRDELPHRFVNTRLSGNLTLPGCYNSTNTIMSGKRNTEMLAGFADSRSRGTVLPVSVGLAWLLLYEAADVLFRSTKTQNAFN